MTASVPTRFGVILAGGASQRFPGGKASASLGGETLLARAVASIRAAGLEPIVCARSSTDLPDVGAAVWREPERDGRPHPLLGISWAAERAGEPIVVLPVDLPLLPPEVLHALAATDHPIAVLTLDGRPAALVARVAPEAAPALRSAADAGAPALRTMLELGAHLVELAEATDEPARTALLNVNTPADLRAAAAILADRPPPAG